MKTVIEDHPTTCSQCMGPFDYRLDVSPGGGLRYTVSCQACDDAYFQVVAPQLPADVQAAAA